MIYAITGMIIAIMFIVNIIIYVLMKIRYEKMMEDKALQITRRMASTIAEKDRESEKQKQDFMKATISIHEREEQNFRLAEANLKLLEQSEELEAQKLKLAEANLQLLELKEEVENAKEQSERLLLNILPARVADELKTCGKSAPECFDNVTVFFSDIVNFTKTASTLEPKAVIEELSDIFTGFDQIFAKHNCERIKTIGDAYMSVSGMPEPSEDHAVNILKAALESRQYLIERNKQSKLQWEMRMGVHSGKVVGGIVGIKKYIYDIFGDTINTASRLEKHAEPMTINVSETTFRLTEHNFNFTRREPVEVKGKGLLQMYYVESTVE